MVEQGEILSNEGLLGGRWEGGGLSREEGCCSLWMMEAPKVGFSLNSDMLMSVWGVVRI